MIVVDASMLAPAWSMTIGLGEQPAVDGPTTGAGQALDDLAPLSLRRVSLLRVWKLRDNLTAYVALAEALNALPLAADGAMGKASGIRCEVEVLA